MVKIYNPEKKTVNIRRDVIIDESKRYKATLDGNLQDIIWDDPDIDEKQVDPNPDEDDDYFYPTYGNDNPLADLEGENSDGEPHGHEHPPSGEPLEQDRPQERPQEGHQDAPRRSGRNTQRPEQYDEWLERHERSSHRNAGASMAGGIYDLMQSTSYHVKVTSESVPETYEQAISGPEAKQWIRGMNEEMEGHEQNKTWTLVKAKPDMHVLEGRWVYLKKYGQNGVVAKHKARWVAKGFEQVYGIDYLETYASTLKWTIIRFLLAYANMHSLEARHIDFVTAFLNARVDTKIYVKQPTGYVKFGEEWVCELLKALYGLKQAPYLWQQTIWAHLRTLGFVQSDADMCLFYRNGLYIAVFVDDILIVGPPGDVEEVINTLSLKFRIKDLGPVTQFLGMTIVRDMDQKVLYIGQQNYLEKVLSRFHMENVRMRSIPLPTDMKIAKFDGHTDKARIAYYQSAVGSLMFAAVVSRPDFAFHAGKLARYLSNPGPAHFTALNYLFGYVRKTLDLGITMRGLSSNGDLAAYADADFAGCLDTRRSTGGYVATFAGNTIAWFLKRQSIVTLSTTEAELVALTNGAKEILWLRKLIKECHSKEVPPTTLYGDNQGSITLSHNPDFRARTKHMDVRFHFVNQNVQAGNIEVKYVPSEEMFADGLTKALPGPAHAIFVKQLGLLASGRCLNLQDSEAPVRRQ
jgi:hypothetical protein